MVSVNVINPKTREIFTIPVTNSGENHMICPVCSKDRKKKTNKCFSYNNLKGVGHCSHCDITLVVQRENENKAIFKPFKRPKWSNGTKVSDRALKWLQSRGISEKTVLKMDIGEGVVYMPQIDRETNVLKFPYFFNGECINIKYRDGAKNFRMESGAELIMYNLDNAVNAEQVVIVEGEIDCMSMVEAGYLNTVSVPNGAGGTNMSWLDHAMEVFKEETQFIIAVDNDPAGDKLKAELIRRLGAENCMIVVFKDCKDANDCLQKYGIQGIIESMSVASEVPMEGVFTSSDIDKEIDDFYHNGLPKGCKTGPAELDELCSFHLGYLSVFTGIPGMGKSEVVDFICTKLNVLYGWKVAYYSPENYPLQLHFSKIAEKLIGKPFEGYNKMNPVELDLAKRHFKDNFFFIKPEEDLSLDNILLHVRKLIRKKGIKIFVIDAWNKLEHMFQNSETQYISRELDRLTMFCEKNQVHLALVAHPTKMVKDKQTGLFEVPSLYNISGSAAFYNKCSLGFSIHRDKEGLTEVHVQKVKFKHWGQTGMCKLQWNRQNGRYSSPNYYDDTNWILEDVHQSNIFDGDAPF